MPMSVRSFRTQFGLTFSILLASSLVLIAGCNKGPQQGVERHPPGTDQAATDIGKPERRGRFVRIHGGKLGSRRPAGP